MIRVVLGVDAAGCLRRMEATGHASVPFGEQSAVCGAVSAVLRSVARVLLDTSGIEVRGEAPSSGILRLEIQDVSRDRRGYLAGLTTLLLRIVEDVAKEAPGEVTVTIETE